MALLRYIGSDAYLQDYSCNSSIDELLSWLSKQEHVQLDTETNVAKSIADRFLVAIQLGSYYGEEVFVVQFSYLSPEDQARLLKAIESFQGLKLIQNASFDYGVLLKYGIVLENVWCTMAAEKVLYAGYDHDLRFFSMVELLQRRLHIDVSKEQQGNFGDDIINDEKLIYAATDVLHLGKVRDQQLAELKERDLLHLGTSDITEHEVVLAFGDAEYYGMGFLPDRWLRNIDLAKPIYDEAKVKLNSILSQEPYLSKAVELKVKTKIPHPFGGKDRPVDCTAVLQDDMFTVNWNSGQQALLALSIVFPDLEKASTLEVKKYLQEKDPTAPKTNEKGKPISPSSKAFKTDYLDVLTPDKFSLLKLFLAKDITVVEKALLDNYKGELIARGLVLPKGHVAINWNSNDAKLAVFKWFNSAIEDTTADTVAANLHTHTFFKAYQNYANSNALLTKYGAPFIDKHVDSDGRVRTSFDTIKSTGRVSSSSPNIQQIPGSKLPKERASDYRNCFWAGREGWSIVSSDYASQELCVIATFSQDPVFLEALRTGKDLHSVCAHVIHGQKWIDIAEPGCKFIELDENGEMRKAKCDCKSHGKLRQETKCLNFGLAYGLGAPGLAADLDITLAAAEELMESYFKAFPNIKDVLTGFGNYGKSNGFICTVGPMRRKRFFPYWNGYQTKPYLMGAIERASKNMPIQGTSADMVKISLIRLRRIINKHKLRDKVQLFAQVHDEIAYAVVDELAEKWAATVTKVMEDAAKECLGNDLLKTDTTISKLWEK